MSTTSENRTDDNLPVGKKEPLPTPNEGLADAWGSIAPQMSKREPEFTVHDVEDYITCVYQVNKNNGMTVFDDPDKGIYQEVPSEGNQLIIFSGNILHYGVTQTDEKARVVINFVMDNNET